MGFSAAWCLDGSLSYSHVIIVLFSFLVAQQNKCSLVNFQSLKLVFWIFDRLLLGKIDFSGMPSI